MHRATAAWRSAPSARRHAVSQQTSALTAQLRPPGGAPLAVAFRGRRSFYDDGVASGANALYLESIYSQWKLDKTRLDPRWDSYFKAIEAGEKATPPSASAARETALEARLAVVPAVRGATGADMDPEQEIVGIKRLPRHREVRVSVDDGPQSEVDMMGVKYLIRAYQVRGHEEANLDPLGQHSWRQQSKIPELQPSYHGFKPHHLDMTVGGGNMARGSTGGNTGFLAMMGGLDGMGQTLGDLLKGLKETYCGSMGVEYMHIADRKRCNWIRSRVENPAFMYSDRELMLKTYQRLCKADTFERFLGQKFKTTKRFGVDGGEAFIPGLQACIDRAIENDCRQVVIGMPHRGRLNVLANILQKPMPQIFSEFMGTAIDVDHKLQQLQAEDWSSAGDVKYHLGTSHVQYHPSGEKVTTTLEANPSHLETVDPVTLGRVKAKQRYIPDEEDAHRRILPILMHGDASFAGQGVVYETMQLAQVDDFHVGGTIHVIVNNQVGFTTDPKNSRSTTYCSDLGKAFNTPIFHVNGDDPIAVVHAFSLAAEWRQDWGSDVIIDFICYRRFGHNETDNPDFTQPLLYQAINKQMRTEELFAKRLVQEGHATQQEVDHIKAKVWESFEQDLEAAQGKAALPSSEWVATKWAGFSDPATPTTLRQATGISKELLKKIGIRLCETPEGFKAHNGIKRVIRQKRERVESGEGIDWATAEALAFGSLLLEGNHVRITGQDVQRGTFSHRHCVVIDQVTQEEYSFLNALNLGPQETFVARNSILSEYAVLGFELGYSYENPKQLIIWEAQFGDFANTAQVMIDQFVSAGEHKWLQQTGLTMLLPHGYDGQGAEHSSCRLERFLQLVDDDEDDIPNYEEASSGRQIQKTNLQVCNFSTPANYFHMLRKQIHRDFRKPLVVVAPKNLLRLKQCVSSFDDMAEGTKFQRVIGERDPTILVDNVKRLVFCSGKIYYELVAERERLGAKDVAIVTLEMIAPFPFDRVREQMELYPNVDPGDGSHPGEVVWCQEEPKNMGAWTYVRPRFVSTAREGLDTDLVMRYVGRRAAAAPATGVAALHKAEQEAILQDAIIGHEAIPGLSRPSPLLGHQT